MNRREIPKEYQKPFIENNNWEGINSSSEKDALYTKKKKYFLPQFQNITQNNIFFKWFQTEKDGIILQ